MKRFKFIGYADSDYRYKLELIDGEWLVTQMTYKTVTGKWVKVEVPQSAGKMLRKELQREHDQRRHGNYDLNATAISLDAPIAEDADCDAYDVLDVCDGEVVRTNAPSDPIHAEVIRNMQYEQLYRAIEQLVLTQREVIIGHYLNGIPFVEIATREGRTASAISHRHEGAKARLKEILLSDPQLIR